MLGFLNLLRSIPHDAVVVRGTLDLLHKVVASRLRLGGTGKRGFDLVALFPSFWTHPDK